MGIVEGRSHENSCWPKEQIPFSTQGLSDYFIGTPKAGGKGNLTDQPQSIFK